MDAAPLDAILMQIRGHALRIIEALWGGRNLNAFDLAAAVYANDPDGGPDYAEQVIRTTICRVRPVLGRMGWRIVATRGPSSTYSLRRVA